MMIHPVESLIYTAHAFGLVRVRMLAHYLSSAVCEKSPGKDGLQLFDSNHRSRINSLLCLLHSGSRQWRWVECPFTMKKRGNSEAHGPDNDHRIFRRMLFSSLLKSRRQCERSGPYILMTRNKRCFSRWGKFLAIATCLIAYRVTTTRGPVIPPSVWVFPAYLDSSLKLDSQIPYKSSSVSFLKR